jgi:DNA-binding LytR/AlgR family response regulator
MAKIILITAVAPVVLRLYDIIVTLRHQNEALVRERKVIQKKVEKYEDDYLNKSIEFISENGTETYSLTIADVIFIRSADNYVEIIHQETGTIRKKLIRNTLKNIERQIKPYSNFIRCHRICIVNMHYIEKLNKSYNTHWVSLKKTDEKIPVSRQYLLKLKDIV